MRKEPIDGLDDTLDALAARDLAVGVISNSDGRLEWRLDEIGILYRIYRRPAGSPATADSLIGIASSDDSLFVDDTGDAGATYA